MIESDIEKLSIPSSSKNESDKTYLLKNQISNQYNQNNLTNEIVLIERGQDGTYSTIMPKKLENVFSTQEYIYLINRINNYKSPSKSFYISMIIFQSLLFLITVSLSFYFLIVGNKLYGLGFFLLFLSVLSLIGATATYFKKSNEYIDEMQEFFKTLCLNYVIKSVKFHGKFKKIGCESLYIIVNSHIFIEFPKSVNENSPVLNQKVPLYSLYNYGTFDQQYYNTNNIPNFVPLNNCSQSQTIEKENQNELL
ncbi:hypothetical protein ACTFIY_000700 [Dictyostelium cf. discoideum]